MSIPKKRVVVITGFESSGSVFLARVVSHVLGRCEKFGNWSGYGWNGKANQDLVIVHRSMPYGRNPKRWLDDLKSESEPLGEYDAEFIICTRDRSISKISREIRFGGSDREYNEDDEAARQIFESIMMSSRYFVFSFESSVALGMPYYRTLYRWLKVESDFDPPVYDANAPYIRKRYVRRLIGHSRRYLKTRVNGLKDTYEAFAKRNQSWEL